MAKGVFSPSVIYGDSSSISCLPYERSKSQILERGETKTHFTNEISQDGIQSSMKNLKIMILWNVCLRGTEHAPWVAIRLKCWQNADIKRNWKSLLSLLRSSPSKTTKSCTAKFFNRSWNNRHYPSLSALLLGGLTSVCNRWEGSTKHHKSYFKPHAIYHLIMDWVPSC